MVSKMKCNSSVGQSVLFLQYLHIWCNMQKTKVRCVHLVVLPLIIVSVVLIIEQIVVMHVPFGIPMSSAPLLRLQTNPREGVSEGVSLFSVREFSRMCCDFGPTVFHEATFVDKHWFARDSGERAQYSFAAALVELKAQGYQTRHNVRDAGAGSVDNSLLPQATRVFVPSSMLREFLNDFFLQLPKDARVVLVTGQEDCGPAELFGFGRTKCMQAMPISLSNLLDDKRLVRWFAQNYDLVGCETVEAMRVVDCTNPVLSAGAQAKIQALPIGLDFHTLGEKKKFGRVNPGKQERMIRSAAATVPFEERPLFVIAAFSVEAAKPDRSVLKAHLANLADYQSDDCLLSAKLSRQKFWKLHEQAAFVLSPQGNGIDTHRVYETLNLGSVPVVHSSPLDSLYGHFPIIIVKQWSDFSSCDLLKQWRADIIKRFGRRPFKNKNVQEKLRLSYWTELTKRASQLERQ